jgi:hypothetical protein
MVQQVHIKVVAVVEQVLLEVQVLVLHQEVVMVVMD